MRSGSASTNYFDARAADGVLGDRPKLRAASRSPRPDFYSYMIASLISRTRSGFGQSKWWWYARSMNADRGIAKAGICGALWGALSPSKTTIWLSVTRTCRSSATWVEWMTLLPRLNTAEYKPAKGQHVLL